MRYRKQGSRGAGACGIGSRAAEEQEHAVKEAGQQRSRSRRLEAVDHERGFGVRTLSGSRSITLTNRRAAVSTTSRVRRYTASCLEMPPTDCQSLRSLQADACTRRLATACVKARGLKHRLMHVGPNNSA